MTEPAAEDAPRLDLDVVKVFRVLAVDDQESILEEIERQLDPLGIEVITARTVADACQVLEDRYVDAAIVDLLIDGSEGGREVLRAMGSHAPAAAAVIASGWCSPKWVKERAMAFGVIKPKSFK